MAYLLQLLQKEVYTTATCLRFRIVSNSTHGPLHAYIVRFIQYFMRHYVAEASQVLLYVAAGCELCESLGSAFGQRSG